jgi:hypothetical protein
MVGPNWRWEPCPLSGEELVGEREGHQMAPVALPPIGSGAPVAPSSTEQLFGAGALLCGGYKEGDSDSSILLLHRVAQGNEINSTGDSWVWSKVGESDEVGPRDGFCMHNLSPAGPLSTSVVVFGGLLDYEERSDVVVVTLCRPFGADALPSPFSVELSHPELAGSDGPAPRWKAASCCIELPNTTHGMVIFGGLGCNGESLDDMWFLQFSSDWMWHRVDYTVVPRGVRSGTEGSPALRRFGASLGVLPVSKDEEGRCLLLLGGASVADGAQYSMAEGWMVRMKAPSRAGTSKTAQDALTASIGALGTVGGHPFPLPAFNGGCTVNLPFPRGQGCNRETVESDSDTPPSGLLLFGGKDTDKGCDDLFFFFDRSSATNTQSPPIRGLGLHPELLALSDGSFEVVCCRMAAVHSASEDAELTALEETARDSNLEIPRYSWPHWRYTGAMVCLPIAANSNGADSLVLFAGGQCRHPDQNVCFRLKIERTSLCNSNTAGDRFIFN